jgi:hypothetical protein
MKTVTQALQEMRQSVENMVASKTERIGSPSLGDVVRQGDIYLVCVDKSDVGRVKTKNRQLAPGETQGSRHILLGDVEIYEVESFSGESMLIGGVEVNTALIGPSFMCIGEVEVDHPEHGNRILPEDTCWRVVYQQAFADEVRRVND